MSSACPVEPAVQLSDLLGKFGNGTIDLDTGDDLLDGSGRTGAGGTPNSASQVPV